MNKTNYLFHFIISEPMTNYISHLKKELGFKKETKLYEFILDIMSKNLPQLKSLIGNHQSEYALIDSPDIKRIHKYARLQEKKYKYLKQWHNDFNEYGMSSILRDIIKFFYEGIIKYGAKEFIEMISCKLDIKKIRRDVQGILTHLIRFSEKKTALFTFIAENLSFYT